MKTGCSSIFLITKDNGWDASERKSFQFQGLQDKQLEEYLVPSASGQRSKHVENSLVKTYPHPALAYIKKN